MNENTNAHDSWLWWRNHANVIRHHISEKELTELGWYITKDNFGYGQGQIRPGTLGQWDVYFANIHHRNVHLMAGLSKEVVQAEEKRHNLEHSGFNPDDPEEVAQYEQLKAMSPTELDQEIARLEQLL